MRIRHLQDHHRARWVGPHNQGGWRRVRAAQTAKLSAEAGRLIETNSANTFADGMAVRVPVPDALDIYPKGAERIITVSDGEISEAIRLYYRLTYNVAEGAGAAPLAEALQEKHLHQG